MTPQNIAAHPAPVPALRDVLELLKPITWFAPVWAFVCGLVSSGIAPGDRWPLVLAGVVLTGPLVCGASQAVNDWYDRHVDAINEPGRPIPSGRVGGTWGLRVAVICSAFALLLGAAMGWLVFGAALVGVACAWAYSAPPLRLKANGWIGPLLVAFTYEGLSWFTGAAVMAGAMPDTRVLMVLVLYSLGAFGIMTLNDFKAVEGDRQMGLRSLPVVLGVGRAALLACCVMALAQAAVIALLFRWGHGLPALIICALGAAQLVLMPRLLSDPARHTPWYAATGVTLYVLGMLAAALGLGGYV